MSESAFFNGLADWPSEEDIYTIAVSDGFGVYIPQIFCQRYEKTDSISEEDWNCCLKGPHWDDENGNFTVNEHYDEAWTNVLDNWGKIYTAPDGSKIKLTIWQDGDVFILQQRIEED